MARIVEDPSMTGPVSEKSVEEPSAFKQLQALPEKLDYLNSIDKETTEKMVDQTNINFDKMNSLWQKGHYKQIVKNANSLPLYCICDIRICVYYLYSLWITSTTITTENIINTLAILLNHKQQPWLATLEQKNEKALENVIFKSTNLFFRQILRHIEKSNIPQKTKNTSPANILQALDNFNKIIVTLQPELGEDIYNLLRMLRKYFSTLQDENKANKLELQPFTQNINDTKQETNDERSESEIGKLVRLEAETDKTVFDRKAFTPSYPLQMLFKRIQLLHKLVEKQQDLKAAIVLNDIQAELENFNPLVYLPEYFISFAALRASNVSNLEPYFCEQESYQWQSLQQYYKTDMQAFLDSDEDNDPLAAKPSYLPNAAFMSTKTKESDTQSQQNNTADEHDE
jgi:hypothetical protein